MNVHAPYPDACSEDRGLLDLDVACAIASRFASALGQVEDVPVRKAAGRCLARGLVATVPLPAFDQAAMDGFAVSLQGGMIPPGTRIPLAGRIAAGDRPPALLPNNATRIFTGAPLPAGADAVAMQEHAWRDEEDLVLGRMLRPGDNVRRRGEDIVVGEDLLSPGMRLDARHVALIAAQGQATVSVRHKVRIGVVSTGNELRQPGTPLSEGTIYDCNRPMIMSFADQTGLDVIDGGWVRDDPISIASVLRELSDSCDLIVSTGGASVGEEDHSATAAAVAGGTLRTLRIALKPGKPAVVGRIGNAAYLGLPGNPVSALVSWLLLGGAMVAGLEGRPFRRRPGCMVRAASQFQRRPGRTEFAPARLVPGPHGPEAQILGRGGSAKLRPLVEADGLVEIHALHAPVEATDTVAFHPFRDGFSV